MISASFDGTLLAILGCIVVSLCAVVYAAEARKWWVRVLWFLGTAFWIWNLYDFGWGKYLVVERADAAAICKPEAE